MTTTPDSDRRRSTALTCTIDAWNRLVQVSDAGGGVLAQYQYDGTGRRIVEFTDFTVMHDRHPQA